MKGARESFGSPVKEHVAKKKRFSLIRSTAGCKDVLDTLGDDTTTTRTSDTFASDVTPSDGQQVAGTSCRGVDPVETSSGGGEPVRSVKTGLMKKVWNKVKAKGPKTYSR